MAHPFDGDSFFVFVLVVILSLAFPFQVNGVGPLQYHGYASTTHTSSGLPKILRGGCVPGHGEVLVLVL